MEDYFQRLGIPRRFSVDLLELEKEYLLRSRSAHPDYHLAGSDNDLAASLELSAAINEAYNVLREPFSRADYLLTLEGGPTASEHKQMPATFLAEMLEAREQVEQVRGSPEEVGRLEAELGGQLAGIMTQVGELFAQYDKLPDKEPVRANLRVRVRSLLNAARYVQGLLRDLND